MKRRAFLLAGLAASLPAWGARERFDRGLLWRVTRDGTRPSHVYGTIHVDGYTRERFMEAAMYLDRQTLEGAIGKQDFERRRQRASATRRQTRLSRRGTRAGARTGRRPRPRAAARR